MKGLSTAETLPIPTGDRGAGLFADVRRGRPLTLPPDAHLAAPALDAIPDADRELVPTVDERTLEVYARARNPDDPFELRDLWLGRVEHELGRHALRPELARNWRAAVARRGVTPEEVLGSRATVRFVKELFNWYFRDDLYGRLRTDDLLVLSSGSVDEEVWGLPETLKECVRHALDRDWYGYSDSCGRVPAREAIAEYENAKIIGGGYGAGNVAITMGGTAAISSLADLILHRPPATASAALCAIPNYPPLVEAVARRHDVRLVPLAARAGAVSLEPLIAALRPDTPLVLLQTVANPTGALVDEDELARLITSAGPSTMIILDECHEWLGPLRPCRAERAAGNVIRVSSLSKTWSAPGMKVGWFLADSRFVAEYYEYASTTFGGPPSFFYTLVEVLARMERWLLAGMDLPGPAELREFEPGYRLDQRRLRAAYLGYKADRIARDAGLRELRRAATARLRQASVPVVAPRYSINAAVELPGWDDSYRCFRDLIRDTEVSVFPGVLTFFFSGGVVRVTLARQWEQVATAIARIGARLRAPAR